VETGEVDKAEIVLDAVFPSSDKATEVVHPGKEPFHLPASIGIGAACARPESWFCEHAGCAISSMSSSNKN
jgi:hypothetical protein